MRRSLASWLGIAALLALGCSQARKPEPQLDSRHVITVDGTTVRYNGKELRWDVPADRWQEVLGPRSRRVRNISVWDEVGVFLFHAPPHYERPGSFVVLLGRKRHSRITETEPEYWPKRTFPGRLVVDGALIHKASTVQEIMRDKKGVAFRRGYLSTVYYYDLEDFYVRLDFGHDRSLTSFSLSTQMVEKPRPGTNE
jgi:hypothetical protein